MRTFTVEVECDEDHCEDGDCLPGDGMRRTRIKSKSKKAAKADAAARSTRRRVIEDADGRCEVRASLADALRRDLLSDYDALVVERALRACTIQAQGVHERRKRSSGGSLSTRENLMAACNRCNDWIEDRPLIARRLGLAVRAGDPEWSKLGAGS